jgi:hypothetical protein
LLVDTPDIAGLIAPRRLMAMWGDLDATQNPNLGCRTSTNAGTQALFNAVGAGASYHYLSVPGMPHEYANGPAYEFFTGTHPVLTLDYGSYRNDHDRNSGIVYQTTCNGMHCCPSGSAMVGIQSTSNDFNRSSLRLVCRRVAASDPPGCMVDRGTQRDGMHACPPGMYMRGASVDRNELTCCTGPTSNERLDTNTTQEQGLHVCTDPEHSVMTGLRADRDQYLCGAR